MKLLIEHHVGAVCGVLSILRPLPEVAPHNLRVEISKTLLLRHSEVLGTIYRLNGDVREPFESSVNSFVNGLGAWALRAGRFGEQVAFWRQYAYERDEDPEFCIEQHARAHTVCLRILNEVEHVAYTEAVVAGRPLGLSAEKLA